MKRCFLKKEAKFDFVYALVLFILLLVIYFPCISTPPRSDYWQMFYFFHHLDELPGKIKWLHILNYDVFEQMRYQPLSRLPHYFLHLLVGSNFVFFNILNFLLYFLSAFLLYKFALNFSKNRVLAAVCVGLFTFLFTHFDILLWSNHMYIIAGLSALILGFMNYIRFLKTGKSLSLYLAILFIFTGTLFYELFFLWPFAIIILSGIKRLKGEDRPNKKTIIKSNWLALGVIYNLYFLFYLFTRSIKTYDQPLREISNFLKLTNFVYTGFLVLFNTLYNNIVINIYPLLSFPLELAENIELGGPMIDLVIKRHEIVFIGATILGISLFICFYCLRRKKYFEEMKIIFFLLFLILSGGCTLFFCRLITNEFEYSLRQFRYQYIFNAIFILIILFIVDSFFALSKNKRKIIYLILILILVLNFYCIRRVINIYNFQFKNLKIMLSNIKTGIRNGYINNKDRLYIDDDIPDYLPILCWNIEMGERFIKGNYQWIFLKKEIECFSGDLKDAIWIIDKEDFSVVRKSPENLSKKGIKINLKKDKDYIEFGKDRKYIELGFFYRDKGNHGKAEEMLKKAIELNPKSQEAYFDLGQQYRAEHRYKEAEEMFKKAIEINPK